MSEHKGSTDIDTFKVRYVALRGRINVGGYSTNNLDAERDGCVLNLHQGTGGVYVERGDQIYFISAMSIESVELVRERAEPAAEPPVESPGTPQTDALGAAAEANTSTQADLADAVLDEFSADKEATPQPQRRRHRA